MSDLISREAVLEINEQYHGQMPNHVNHEIWKEIKALPSFTPQPEKHTEERTETHACDCISRETHVCDCISRQAAEKKLKKVVDEMALIFADIREKNVDDSVCGLCEYDCFKLKEGYRKQWTDLSDIPSVDPDDIDTHESVDRGEGEI